MGADLSIGILNSTVFGHIQLSGAGNPAIIDGTLNIYFPGAPPIGSSHYDVVVANAIGAQIMDNSTLVAPPIPNLQLIKTLVNNNIVRITSLYAPFLGDTINSQKIPPVLAQAQHNHPDLQYAAHVFSMLPDEEVTSAAEALIPAVDQGQITATQATLLRVFDITYRRRISEKRRAFLSGINAGDGDAWETWGEAYGTYFRQNPLPTSKTQGLFATAGYRTHLAGVALGGDMGNWNTVRIGLAGGYSDINVNSQALLQNILNINSYQLTAYGWLQPFDNAFFTQVNLGLAANQYHNTRPIVIGGGAINTAATARYHGLHYGTELEAGYVLARASFYVAPHCET